MPRRLLACLILGSALLGSCAMVQEPRCASRERAAVHELLYFGTARAGGVVSASEWSAFLAATVTPRFPQGFSVWPVAGQWQSASDGIISENAYVLDVVREPGTVGDRAVQEIVEAYKSQFQQEAVLRVRSDACISF